MLLQNQGLALARARQDIHAAVSATPRPCHQSACTACCLSQSAALSSTSCSQQLLKNNGICTWQSSRPRLVSSASLGVEPLTSSDPLAIAMQFLHFEETNDYSALLQVVEPDVKWRQRGLLQGRATLRGAEQVRNALKQMHTSYQDLQYNVNLAAEEVDKVVVYWTATGVNRSPMHGLHATFRKSTFSGVSLFYLSPDARVREVVEYRQPTREEMTAHLRADSGSATIQSLLAHGHTSPSGKGTHPSPSSSGGATVDSRWRACAVGAATEWVENWTPGPDLEQMVRDDFEELNRFSWPDFEGDVVGKDALAERCARPSQDAVAILDTIAGSSTGIVAVLWNDFQQVLSEEEEQASSSSSSSSSASGTSPTTSTSSSDRDAAITTSPSSRSASSSSSSSTSLPSMSLPRAQPALDATHGGGVEVRDGHLRLTQPNTGAARSRALSSEDEAGGSAQGGRGGLHAFSGITLFQVDADGRMAWSLTFRELNASEKKKYVVSSAPLPAAAAQK